MLYSHNLENEKLNLFTLFLNKAVQGEVAYASIVNDVILETHQYVLGEKTLYNITRDSMNIILLLANAETEYFKNIANSPDQYNTETYNTVLNLITKNQPSLVF